MKLARFLRARSCSHAVKCGDKLNAKWLLTTLLIVAMNINSHDYFSGSRIGFCRTDKQEKVRCVWSVVSLYIYTRPMSYISYALNRIIAIIIIQSTVCCKAWCACRARDFWKQNRVPTWWSKQFSYHFPSGYDKLVCGGNYALRAKHSRIPHDKVN
jgi:hypothetical protein